MSRRKNADEAEKGLSPAARLFNSFGIGGETALSARGLVEWRGRTSVNVSGCRRILSYGKERIVLDTVEGTLFVCGRGLSFTAYYANAVGIEGKIDSVSYGTFAPSSDTEVSDE